MDGTQAYFDLINSEGGVNGRKIYIKYQENDGGSTTNDETEARTLVEQDHVFAVVAVGTPFFTGSTFLAQSGTPTFGYVVTAGLEQVPEPFRCVRLLPGLHDRRADRRVPRLGATREVRGGARLQLRPFVGALCGHREGDHPLRLPPRASRISTSASGPLRQPTSRR